MSVFTRRTKRGVSIRFTGGDANAFIDAIFKPGVISDEPLIKSVDSDVEKAVNAVIKDATKDAHAEVHV